MTRRPPCKAIERCKAGLLSPATKLDRVTAVVLNVRKPLEGVLGLLLLASLVLFGATIGVSLALVFSWVEMKDSLANFLGGVVGAGLGAALAVLGALYVQRAQRRAELARPINLVAGAVDRLGQGILDLFPILTECRPEDTIGDDMRAELERSLADLDAQLKEKPDASDLARSIYLEVNDLWATLPHLSAEIRHYLDCHGKYPVGAEGRETFVESRFRTLEEDLNKYWRRHELLAKLVDAL